MYVRSKGVCMQINSVVNPQIMQKKQNFKGSSANSSPFSNFPSYQPIPLETSKAYASPQIIQGYREIETFDVPYVGKGKLYELTNGHKVAIVPKPGPFMINTCVKAGQDKDPVISHFVEHLVYNFDTQIDNEAFSSFQRRLGIDGNAETHDDHTNYWMQYPFEDKETIDKIIKAQAQILQQPKTFKTQMEKEKNILISEATIRSKDKGNPDENIPAYLLLNNLLGLDEKPIKDVHDIEKIKNTTSTELEDFYKKYYNNNNMVTFIVGDLNPDETIKTFAKYFNKPNNSDSITIKTKKQDLSKLNQQAKRFDINLNSKIDKNVKVGFIGPKNDDIKDNFLSLALKIYIQDIKNNKNLTYTDINTETLPATDSLIIFSASFKPENEKLILENINKYVKNLAQKQISDKDFEALKIHLKEGFTSFNESSYVMSIIGGEKLLYSNKIDFFEYPKLIDSLKKEDLQNFAKKYFDLNKAVVVVAHEKPTMETFAHPSFTGNKTTLDTSNIVEYQYPDSNLQLIVDTSPAIARTSFRLDFVSNEIPNIKPGTLKLLTYMMIDNFDNYQSSYPFISDPELKYRLNELGLITTCPPEYSKDLIKIVKNHLLNPKLTQQGLDEAKNNLKKYNTIMYDKTVNTIRKEKYSNYNYTDSLIEYSTPEEYSKVIDNITLEDVINLHKQLINNSQGKSILVIPKETFEAQKKEILDAIDSDIPQLKPKQNIKIADKILVTPICKTKVLTDIKNDNNALIQQDFQIIKRDDLKESIGVELLKIILGQERNSRLESEIRDKQGLSYATGAKFNSDGRLGYLSLISNLPLEKSNAGNLQKVLNTFRKNISDLVNNSVSNEELEMAKTNFKSNIIQKLEYSEARNDLIYEYGINETRNLFETLNSITPNDIQNLSQKVLKKPSIIIIKANQDVIDSNKNYLSTLGEII